MNTNTKVQDRFDWTLFFYLFLFFLISVIAISSAQQGDSDPINYALRQAIFYGVCIFIIPFTLLFEPEQFQKLSWILYGMGMLLLLFILVAPDSLLAKPYPRSWFSVPGLGSLQPSEFMKTFLILLLSRIIVEHHDKHEKKTIKTDVQLFAKISFITVVPLALVMKQPDLGTSLVFIAIYAGLILVSGISWKVLVPSFLSLAMVGIVALGLILYNPEFLEEKLGLDQYQFDRIYTWLDPYNYHQKEGYNLVQALTAIGSGQIFGKGYQEKEVYVPERHTDFIFTVIGEEYGFIGASFVICLFFLFIYHIVKMAIAIKDPFSSYVCAGIISMITFHVLENIGMCIQLLPITGIPLPFISYGGSSLMGNMLAVGILFSIRYYHKTYMFSD